MATSKVEICNAALYRIGANAISSMAENSKEARHCSVLFDPLRDELLTGFQWPFAQKRAALALVTDGDAVFDDYDYVYQVPSDCLRFHNLEDPEAEFVRIGDQILTNEEDAKGVYTRAIENVADFSRSFTTVFVARLALELAWPISHDKGLVDRQFKIYTTLRAQAEYEGAQEINVPVRDTDSGDWISSAGFLEE